MIEWKRGRRFAGVGRYRPGRRSSNGDSVYVPTVKRKAASSDDTSEREGTALSADSQRREMADRKATGKIMEKEFTNYIDTRSIL